jgi:putative ABC transport system permease protein
MRLGLFLEGIRIGLGAIRANVVRSGLTVLGVAIGVAVVVTIASLVTGIRSVIVEGVEVAGPSNLIVTRFDFTNVRLTADGSGRPAWWRNPEITAREANALAALPGVHEALYSFDFTSALSWDGERLNNVLTRAISSGWPAYSVGRFAAGRDFTEAELREARPVIVLSRPLAERLFGQVEPVGKHVRVRSGGGTARFRVVGVFAVEENIFSAPQPYWALLPWTSATRTLNASGWQAQVLVVPREDADPSLVQDDLIGTLRGMRGLNPRDENDFAVLRSEQFLEFFDRITGVFFLVMIALSSVALMVGGVGVIGIMLIAVTERTREIGVRKALGATRKEILWQFLVEAAALTTVGGAAGLLIGAAGAWSVERWTPIPAEIPLWSVLAALAMAAMTGVLFGLFPAIRASRMAPVEALRHER